MKGFLLRGLGFVLAMSSLLANFSCAHDQQLVSIQVLPTTETFGTSTTPVSSDTGLNVNLRALGTYIHPPVTKDITDQVTWTSNTPQMVSVDSTGVLTATGSACGNALVFATVNTNKSAGGLGSTGAVVTGSMTANVVCYGGSGGSGAADVLLTVDITGTGTISSTPPALGCTTTCSDTFPSGTVLVLTATPTGSATTATWVGCDSMSGNTCTVALVTNRTISVTFS